MKVIELSEYAKTSPDTKYCLILTDVESMVNLPSRTLSGKIASFSSLVHDALEKFLIEKYSNELKNEEEAAMEAIRQMIEILSEDASFIEGVLWYSVDVRTNECVSEQLYAQMMGWA